MHVTSVLSLWELALFYVILRHSMTRLTSINDHAFNILSISFASHSFSFTFFFSLAVTLVIFYFVPFHPFCIVLPGFICLPCGQQLTQHHIALCAFIGSLPCHVTATSSAESTREQFISYQPARHLCCASRSSLWSHGTLLSSTKQVLIHLNYHDASFTE